MRYLIARYHDEFARRRDILSLRTSAEMAANSTAIGTWLVSFGVNVAAAVPRLNAIFIQLVLRYFIQLQLTALPKVTFLAAFSDVLHTMLAESKKAFFTSCTLAQRQYAVLMADLESCQRRSNLLSLGK